MSDVMSNENLFTGLMVENVDSVTVSLTGIEPNITVQ